MRLLKLRDPIFHRFKKADYLSVKGLNWRNKAFFGFVFIYYKYKGIWEPDKEIWELEFLEKKFYVRIRPNPFKLVPEKHNVLNNLL